MPRRQSRDADAEGARLRSAARCVALSAPRHVIAVLEAQRAGRVLGQRVAVSLAVGGPHERRDDLEAPLGHVRGLAPQLGQTEVDIELEQVDTGWLIHVFEGTNPVGRTNAAIPPSRYSRRMGRIRLGPAHIPDRESPETAIELLLERGYNACEIDFESGFWMDYPWAERLGELAREHDVALSVHAPLFGWVGHLEASGRKWSSALGALDRSAGIATACGAELVVFHPGFLLGRSREDAIDSVVEQLALVRERLVGKGRGVPFGIEVMGRVRDFGSLDDCVEISRRTGWVRPVIDFAHMHATSDGAYTEPEPFRAALELADGALEEGTPFHIHFSDIAYANRNETKHLPYGEGTLRADPLREALAAFERSATVISESPDEGSTQMIRAALSG